MKKILFSILILLSCDVTQNPDYKNIDLGKTQKVKVQENYQSEYTLSYLWKKIDGPENHNSKRIINGNMMLLKPGVSGKYIITVSVQNSMGNILGEEKFYYNVLDNNEYINELSSEVPHEIVNEPTTSNINKSKNKTTGYTIQIASWDNIENAIEDRDDLQRLNFDAYIKESLVEGKELYRVRVGKNLSYDDCNQLIKNLKKITNENLWIDKFEN